MYASNLPPANKPQPGTLFLVPAPLNFGCDGTVALATSMPAGTLLAASNISHWVYENAKSTRAYLKRIHETHPLCQPLKSMQLQELPREMHKKRDHGGGFDARLY